MTGVFCGLDYHVGLIFKYQERLYFIHSNYLVDVDCRAGKNSEAFFSYGIYIAAITTNKSLIKELDT